MLAVAFSANGYIRPPFGQDGGEPGRDLHRSQNLGWSIQADSVANPLGSNSSTQLTR